MKSTVAVHDHHLFFLPTSVTISSLIDERSLCLESDVHVQRSVLCAVTSDQ